MSVELRVPPLHPARRTTTLGGGRQEKGLWPGRGEGVLPAASSLDGGDGGWDSQWEAALQVEGTGLAVLRGLSGEEDRGGFEMLRDSADINQNTGSGAGRAGRGEAGLWRGSGEGETHPVSPWSVA